MKFANFDLAEKFTQNSKELINLDADFDKYYSEYTWDYNMKKNSIVIARLMPFVPIFRQLNLTLDRVVVTLVAIEYYATACHQSSYFECPDRFLTLRNQKSRYVTNQIIYILSKTNLINLKYENGKMYIKPNRTELSDDVYFQHQCDRFLFTNRKKLDECIYKKDSVKYFKPSNYTKYKNMRHSILGLTLAYNVLVQECLFKEDKFSNYNQRLEIQYLELPVEIIQKELRLSELRLRNYMGKLEKYSDYLAKHDLAYTKAHDMEGNLIEHWFNPKNYKKTALKDIRKLEAEYGKPLVTKNSYVLFTENFERTRTGKAVYKNLHFYIEIVKRHLAFYNVDKLSGNTDDESYLDEDYNCTSNFDSSEKAIAKKYAALSDFDKESYFAIYSGESRIGSIIDVDKIHALTKKEIKNLILPNSEKMKGLGVEKVISLLGKVVGVMDGCDSSKITYYLRKFDELNNRFKEFKEEYTSKGLFDTYLPQIYSNKLGLLLN